MKKFCAECGTKYSGGRFCINCGASMEDENDKCPADGTGDKEILREEVEIPEEILDKWTKFFFQSRGMSMDSNIMVEIFIDEEGRYVAASSLFTSERSIMMNYPQIFLSTEGRKRVEELSLGRLSKKAMPQTALKNQASNGTAQTNENAGGLMNMAEGSRTFCKVTYENGMTEQKNPDGPKIKILLDILKEEFEKSK